MLLFVILAMIAIICTIVIVGVASIGGSVAVLIFGDVIVCIAIIIWIIVRKINN